MSIRRWSLVSVALAFCLVAAGHSQGGHAALFVGEEAAGYAPELRLKGVIAVAPGTELDEPSYVTTYMKPAAVMTLAGLALDYPEIEMADYLTPEAEARLGVLETGCLDDIIVPSAFTQQYIQRACAAGTKVKYSLYPTADHGTIISQSAQEARQWLTTIAANQPPPTSC